MRKVLLLIICLLTLSMIVPGLVYAPAQRIEVSGNFSMTATWPGDIYVLNSGMVRQVGALASGPIDCSDNRLTGELSIVLNAVFSLNTGGGVGFGTFTITPAAGLGTFEGSFRVKDTGFTFFEGSLDGRGTGSWKGTMFHIEMSGTDWYRDADPSSYGIVGTFTGYMLFNAAYQ